MAALVLSPKAAGRPVPPAEMAVPDPTPTPTPGRGHSPRDSSGLRRPTAPVSCTKLQDHQDGRGPRRRKKAYPGDFKEILDDGEGNGNPLQYSCLENPMDRGAW